MMKWFDNRRMLVLAVAAAAAIGCSSPTSPEEETLEEDTTVPPVPKAVTGETGNGELVIDWDAVYGDDLQGYYVYRAENSIPDSTSLDPINGGKPVSGTSYTDSTVTNGTTYHYRISSVDTSENESGLSVELVLTPFPDPPNRP
ncbi:hypothetical protein [Halalkalibaculum sp. DA384]|uniref:hypothetical protein n=1 Tax=Halalkalibaculum sp. DA384 TaxID=3373606 RepID=UPI003754DD95